MEVKQSKLSILLDTYQKQNGKGDSYKNVLMELVNGDSFLFLPSSNDDAENQEPNADSPTKKLKLTSVFTLDGINVLAAFSDEKALFSWAKEPVHYKMVQSKDVLKICEDNAIKRIVINTNMPNMFVLEQE